MAGGHIHANTYLHLFPIYQSCHERRGRSHGLHAEGADACRTRRHLKNSFVNFSLCAPSRSSFFTGETAHNDDIKSNQAAKGGGWSTFRSYEANDLASWFQRAGYKTALIGKYMNGYGKHKSPQADIAIL